MVGSSAWAAGCDDERLVTTRFSYLASPPPLSAALSEARFFEQAPSMPANPYHQALMPAMGQGAPTFMARRVAGHFPFGARIANPRRLRASVASGVAVVVRWRRGE